MRECKGDKFFLCLYWKLTDAKNEGDNVSICTNGIIY